MECRINSRAMTLLREWYFRTREVNFKSCYPSIAARWERCGLAWQQVGVGFELSRCTSPRELQAWEEAGHQFLKLEELQQALILGNRFHGWTVTELATAAGLARYVAQGHIRVGLRRYESLCMDCGLIDEEGELAHYLSGMKQIGSYLGVSAKTVRRWVLDAELPVKRVDGGSILAHKDDLDLWFMQNCERASVRRMICKGGIE